MLVLPVRKKNHPSGLFSPQEPAHGNAPGKNMPHQGQYSPKVSMSWKVSHLLPVPATPTGEQGAPDPNSIIFCGVPVSRHLLAKRAIWHRRFLTMAWSLLVRVISVQKRGSYRDQSFSSAEKTCAWGAISSRPAIDRGVALCRDIGRHFRVGKYSASRQRISCDLSVANVLPAVLGLTIHRFDALE